eukprot:CAMPEP_0182477556 /NCGR_PEP_ID=MMETSP1319-20130603/31065_1 /TAXON_ID=172717 /ORGANISM="Bolidomonas pacifica, Strain RCC208" /LENGTH=74 /DNA_ID=CAMNT_0024678803 /DNA_START=1 /DNA_END=222 /DNA_ORIENTATION=-
MSRSSTPKHTSATAAPRESAAFDPDLFLQTSQVGSQIEAMFQSLLLFRPADPILFLRDHLRALAKEEDERFQND